MISINFDDAVDVYRPGNPIAGTVTWSEEEATSLDVRLFWRTVGKGDTDLELVSVQEFQINGVSGSQKFQFTAPHRPSSFSGTLVSLLWSVEAILRPGETTALEDLVISKSGQEVDLVTGAPEQEKVLGFFQSNG